MIGAADLNDDEIALLSDHDDDFYGLWEVDWHFNRTRPEWSWHNRRDLFAGLVQRGLMSVFFGPLQTERPPLTAEAALKGVADPAAWEPPLAGQEIGFYVTTSSLGMVAIQPGTE